MRLTQIEDVARALLLAQGLKRHDRWTRERLRRHQQRSLDALVRHAASRSPFYRALYRGLPLQGAIALSALPTTDKRTLMEHFDDVVTDRRLKLRDLEAQAGRAQGDACYLGEYRVLVTSGSSGLRGLFVYDRPAWRWVLANTLRWQRFAGVRGRWPLRLRICSIGADDPAHISRRIPESGRVGLFKLLHLNAAQPLSHLVAALNAFRPQVLMSYPSIAALLAEEQRAGRLAIRPGVVTTHSEALTAETDRRLRDAWGVAPFNHYGLTEEPHVACDCTAHAGLHIFEDLCLVEVLDEAGRPATPGTLGTRYLLTNLYNRVQPLIRYEVSDLIATTDAPCACGRPFARIVQIAGRREEALVLRARDGREIVVPPVALTACLETLPGLVEFELRHGPAAIEVVAVPRGDAEPDALEAAIVEALNAALRAFGAVPPRVSVHLRARIERRDERMGKLRPITGLRGR